MVTTIVVLRAGMPWMTVRDAIYEAVRCQQPPLLIRQRSNGQLRVRELRTGLGPVRIDIELYPQGIAQTVIELRDATHLPARVLPGAAPRRRAVMESLRRYIESAAAASGAGQVKRIDRSGTAGLDPIGHDDDLHSDLGMIRVPVSNT